MGIHPNAILMLTLTPDDLTRKTYREILADTNVTTNADVDDDPDIIIGGAGYHVLIMEGSYDGSFQVSANEGDIVLIEYITYGYGQSISWGKLQEQKEQLEQWAVGICERHKCKYKISVTANYW